MKRLLALCCVICVGWLCLNTSVSAEVLEETPAPAAVDAPTLFETNCAGCHINGGNIIRRGKNLKQRALRRYGYEDAVAISSLITNGKGNMSAYGDKLNPEEIEALAQYVLDRAATNWK